MMKTTFLTLLSLLPMTSMAQTTTPNDSIFMSTTMKEMRVKIPSKTRMKDGNMLTRIVATTAATAGNALDALAHVPGMMRMQGEMQVIGKGAPVYYINGRKVQDISELQRLSSHDIKDVEVISNPGSEYGAEVKAVVRIRTLRPKGEGLGVSADMKNEYAPSQPNNTLATHANLNYRHDALDVFGGLSFDDCYLGHYDTESSQESFSLLNKQAGTVLRNMQTGTTHTDQQYDQLGYHLGFNYMPNDSTSFGVKVERSDNLKGFTHFAMDEDILQNDRLVDHLYSDTKTDADGLNSWLANAYFNGKFGQLGMEWNADFYSTNSSQTASTFELSNAENQSRGESVIKRVTSHADATNRLLATKLVFSYPLWLGQLQAGTELTFTKRNSTYDITEASINDDQSSVKENNYALFASYNMMIPRAGMLNFGLRYEHVDFQYDNDHDSSLSLSRNTDNVFPFVRFSTQLGEAQASLSYTAKTRRPNYRLLRTNIEYNNRFCLSTGDPTLSNEIDHQVDLSARWDWLSGSLTYSCQKNGIYDWTYPYDDNGTVLLSWVNLDRPIHRLMAYVNASPMVGVWQPSYTVGYQKQWLSMDLADPRTATGIRTVSYNRPMYIFLANNTFRIPLRNASPLCIELNSEFLSSAHFGNAELTNNFWNLSVAVQKSFLKNDALSVRLSMGDIFHTAYHNAVVDLGNYVSRQSHVLGQQRDVYDFQRLSLSVRYTFNAVKSKYKGTGAGRDSRDRM